MNFGTQDLQLIIFLCMERKSSIGLEEAEKQDIADLYRKSCAILRGYSDE